MMAMTTLLARRTGSGRLDRNGQGASGPVVRCLGIALLFAGLASASAQENGAAGKPPPDLPKQELRILGPDGQTAKQEKPTTEVEAYCLNIADKAQDARYALEKRQLGQLEGEISKRIDELEAKRQSYQSWLEERKAFLDSASSIVVDIYAAMKADAAAAQLSRLSRGDAAALLVKLKSRQASDILSEMKPDTAAEIAALIVAKTSAGTASDAQAAVTKQPSESRS